MTLIILEPLASSRKGDLFGFTIGSQVLIDEFTPIISIEPQDWKWKKRSRLLQRQQDSLCVLGEQGQAFGPSGGKIGEGHGVKKASLGLRTTMSHQIGFQKAGASLIPLLERADGNPLFEQRPGVRRGNATQPQCSL